MSWPDGPDARIVSAPTLEEAMANARRRYGAHVQFAAARTVARGIKGLLGHEVVEVLVAPGSIASSAISSGGTPADGSDGHAFATLEELLHLADGADGIGPRSGSAQGNGRPHERAYEQAYGHRPDPMAGPGIDGGTGFPSFGTAADMPVDEVSFDALVRQALDRVPSQSTRVPGRPSQLQHPAPDVVVDPVAVPRLRPTPIRRAQLALAAAPDPTPAPRWSRRRLTAVGLPRPIAEGLPLRAADDDAGWTAALAESLSDAIDSACAAAGSAPVATVSGRGGKGAITIVKALALGAVPNEFDDGNGMRPATADALARAIRGLL